MCMSEILMFMWIMLLSSPKKTSPFKLSILLLAMSVLSALYLINKTLSLWTTSLIILIFSSGMMILFCYSSSLISTETMKPLSVSFKTTTFVVLLTLMFCSEQNLPFIDLSMKEFTSNLNSVTAMTVLILFLIPMMENCFNPLNPMQSNF